MERKIGEIFEHEGKKLRVEESKSDNCGGCFFNGQCPLIVRKTAGECQAESRVDNKYVIFVEVQEQPQLNLCEILKHCPKGEKFWSPMFGYVVYCGIIKGDVGVTVASGVPMIINADGTLTINLVTSPEIMLYPSREQRDWTKVKYEPKKERFDPKTLKPFDRVLVNHDDIWKVDFFSHICQYEPNGWCQCIGDSYYICIPYNDETKHLVGTKEEAPDFYRYWED